MTPPAAKTKALPQSRPLRVLIHSHFFPPSAGGTEAVGLALASELARLGCAARVVTTTLGADDPGWAFEVIRGPSWAGLIGAAAWADVVLHNPLSLKAMLAASVTRRPSVIGVHNWLDHLRHRGHPVVRLRRLALRRAAAVVCASEALARSVGPVAVVIPNPIDTAPFEKARAAQAAAGPRSGILCAGRLVSDKGFDTAIEAVARLNTAGMPMPLRIAGEGPERARLAELASRLGAGGLVSFTGAVPREMLAELMAASKFCAVPSRWAEPFGIVAVEALAAGCLTIVSETGGLPEAAGGLGWTVPPGDPAALAARIAALRDAAPPPEEDVARHLEQFRPERAAARWLEILRRAAA